MIYDSMYSQSQSALLWGLTLFDGNHRVFHTTMFDLGYIGKCHSQNSKKGYFFVFPALVTPVYHHVNWTQCCSLINLSVLLFDTTERSHDLRCHDLRLYVPANATLKIRKRVISSFFRLWPHPKPLYPYQIFFLVTPLNLQIHFVRLNNAL